MRGAVKLFICFFSTVVAPAREGKTNGVPGMTTYDLVVKFTQFSTDSQALLWAIRLMLFWLMSTLYNIIVIILKSSRPCSRFIFL